MRREFTIGAARQRGLGPPAWRRALGLTILFLAAAVAVLFTVEIR